MVNYADYVANRRTKQTEQADPDQVVNNAGGYSFQVSEWDSLNRFLIIGGYGTYYVGEGKITIDSVKNFDSLIKSNYKKFVDSIVNVSSSGIAPKNTPAVFALAYCAVKADNEHARAYAYENMPKVARYSTDLFFFVDAVKTLKNGKSSTGLKRAIARWYNTKTASAVAYQACKYPSRKLESMSQSFSHRDLLRISRPQVESANKAFKTPSEDHNYVYRYIVKGIQSDTDLINYKNNSKINYIYGHEQAKRATTTNELVDLIHQYDLSFESIPSEKFTKEVWSALLKEIPAKALLRNLGRLTANGVLSPLSDDVNLVVNKISNEKYISDAMIHPVDIFIAQKVYSHGRGIKGALSWTPDQQILSALNKSFYSSFKYGEKSDKRYLIGLDVSGSMSASCLGNQLISAREASAFMSLSLTKSASRCHFMAFTDSFIPLDIGISDDFKSVTQKISDLPFGNTDCAMPMIYAMKKEIPVDVFVVMTDNETWAGNIHPHEALNDYRKKMKIDAKLAVCAFSTTRFTIGDPKDNNTINLAGFDSSIPRILAGFAEGNI